VCLRAAQLQRCHCAAKLLPLAAGFHSRFSVFSQFFDFPLVMQCKLQPNGRNKNRKTAPLIFWCYHQAAVSLFCRETPPILASHAKDSLLFVRHRFKLGASCKSKTPIRAYDFVGH